MATKKTPQPHNLAEFDRQIRIIAESGPEWPLWHELSERSDSDRIVPKGSGADQLPETPRLSEMNRDAKLSRFERDGGDTASQPDDGFPEGTHHGRDNGGHRAALGSERRRMLPESYDARLFAQDTPPEKDANGADR